MNYSIDDIRTNNIHCTCDSILNVQKALEVVVLTINIFADTREGLKIWWERGSINRRSFDVMSKC